MKKNKTIAIIPARGGSKRLQNKNIKPLGAHPLLVHSLLYAKQNKHLIDTICITTDDEAVKTIASQYDVQLIQRPKQLSHDTATTVSALKHVLQSIDKSYETIILLQPTNPLRPKKLLENAYHQFIERDYDSLMTVTRNHQKLGKVVSGKFIPFNYTMGQRSQDLEPLFYENGLLYITKTSLIMDNTILSKNNFPFIVDHPFAQIDIDTEEDLKFAEYILKQYPDA